MTTLADHRQGIRSKIELILAVVFLLVYALARLYPEAQPFASNPIAATLVLQIFLGIAFIYIVALLLEGYGKAAYNERETHEVIHIFRLIAYPVLIIVLLHTLSISIGSLLVGAGFLGIIVGLAAQTSLGNVFAGLSILYARPFSVGDKIKFTPLSLGMQPPTYPHLTMFTEITGTVKSIGIIYTRLLKDDLSIIYIPNTALNQGFIHNLSRLNERLLTVRLEVSRDTDIEAFEKSLILKLSEDSAEYDRLMNLDIKLSLMSTEQDLGVIITARVNLLDYDRLSQWVVENSLKALQDIKAQKTPVAQESSTKKGSRRAPKRNRRKRKKRR